MLYVQRRRWALQVAEIRAGAQAALGGEEAVEAFKDFQNLMNHEETRAKKQQLGKALEDIKKIKAISFKPIGLTRDRRKTARRVSREDVEKKLSGSGFQPVKRVRRHRRRIKR